MKPRFYGHFFRLLIDLLFQSYGALFLKPLSGKSISESLPAAQR